jgi:hypothetical protein
MRAGVPWPNPRFADLGNGTVTDNLTGLMWTKDANRPGTDQLWQGALDYVAGMNAGIYPNFGYTDWRLPNVNELESLIDAERSYPALPSGHPFTNVQNSNYWSLHLRSFRRGCFLGVVIGLHRHLQNPPLPPLFQRGVRRAAFFPLTLLQGI